MVCVGTVAKPAVCGISCGGDVVEASVIATVGQVLGVAGDASRDVTSNVTGSALIATVVLMAASGVGVWWLGRRREVRRPFAWFAALGTLAVCMSLTLARDGAPETFRPSDALAWATSGWDRLVQGDLLWSSQFLLNVALFVPAGVACVWLTLRPRRTLLGLAGLSILIESLQAVSALGAADIGDVVANTVGAAIGVTAGTFATSGIVRSGESESSPAVGRKRGAFAAVTAIAVSAAVIIVIGGAERNQRNIRHELERAFSDTTYAEVYAVLIGDPDDPDRLSAGTRFDDSEQIFGAISVRADGSRAADDRIELRWPARFFGMSRCVYVTWTPATVEFDDRSGSVCTDFMG